LLGKRERTIVAEATLHNASTNAKRPISKEKMCEVGSAHINEGWGCSCNGTKNEGEERGGGQSAKNDRKRRLETEATEETSGAQDVSTIL